MALTEHQQWRESEYYTQYGREKKQQPSGELTHTSNNSELNYCHLPTSTTYTRVVPKVIEIYLKSIEKIKVYV